MSCARCGCGVYKTEEFISLNKVWHKYCFTCYQCNKRLDKDSAKIFQGELFCQHCYTSVIEKLFEVISTPSVDKPCRVVSTPSCTADKAFVQTLKDRETSLKKNCKNKEYCFSAEKKDCIQRTTQSCSCIPNQLAEKDEYCFVFPIPREVANYYNRSHMKTKACKYPNTCPACTCCSNRSNRCEFRSPVRIRVLKNQCNCNSCVLKCGNNLQNKCFCSRTPSPPPCIPVIANDCGCCLFQQPEFRRLPQTYDSSCSSPCQACQYCHKQPRKPKCPPISCPQTNCGPPKSPPSAKCCPPSKYCAPFKCQPAKWYSPQEFFTSQMDEYRTQPCFENSQNCCKNPARCCCQTAKYCVCGNLNPCNCKMSDIRAQCTVCCNRCEQKVYAAEKVIVSSGTYHTSCFTCYCCNRCLDIKNVFEGRGEIYCKQCYNHFFGIQYYGFGRPNC